MWDPGTYLRYRDERSRPFYDLVGRILVAQPRTVVDLGCGPGELTADLARRWPDAAVVGIDSSAEMIARAAATGGDVDFHLADIRDWTPDDRVDVVVCNAVLQWVPEHERLLTRWVRQLAHGSVLAVQVPNNFDAPSHLAVRAVAEQEPYRDDVVPLLRRSPVRDAIGYADLLTAAGCAVDAWETTYLHLLPAEGGADHPVLGWLEGTALRPIRAALGPTSPRWARFRAAVAERLAAAYPVRAGQVYFPFRRVFFVARVGGQLRGSS
ncbi:MAG TPA: trans-aconitate 2-methyltransferase [Micromonosporaceae bacterium]